MKNSRDISSPRNACVGLLRSNSETLLDTKLNFVAYSLSKSVNNSYISNINALEVLGFYVGWSQELIVPSVSDNSTAEKFFSDLLENKTRDREIINFDADGIVLKVCFNFF